MKWWIWSLFVAQLAVAGYGLYAEFGPAAYQLHPLPNGMGLALAAIAATMTVTLAVVEKERNQRAAERKSTEIWDCLAQRCSFCLPVHEREFYSLWPAQVATAQNNIDVCHLGPKPPQNQHGKEESKYFSDLKRIYKDSNAQIRRIERLTPEKIPWIKKLTHEFEGTKNFSLKVYKDPFDTEMPAALSVSRIDDRYAWIVAIAEHESTSNYRDLLITGHDGVELIRRYFQERLWARGREILTFGVLNTNWEKELII